jgi:glycosyltransferase involved in cell wall biosynthesis
MMEEPLATFLVPAYNAMPFIMETVKSMQSQTECNFRALIVSDRSSDGTEDFLRYLRDERFTVIRGTNSGLVNALNLGAERVRTKYIARLDADDISMPQRLEKQLQFLEKSHEVAAVGTRMGYIYGKSRHFRVGFGRCAIQPSYAPPMKHPPFWNPAHDGQTIPHPSVTMRTDAFRGVGGYRLLPMAEDVDLWLRLSYAGHRLACLDEVLTLYRISSTSVSSRRFYELVQTTSYVYHCHECRLSRKPEPTFQTYTLSNPPSPTELRDAQSRFHLRLAIGTLLSGRFIKSLSQLSKIVLTNPHMLLGKIKERL